MQPFTTLTGVAVPLLQDDINTDQITPINRNINPDWAALLFGTPASGRTAAWIRTFRSTSRSSGGPPSW